MSFGFSVGDFITVGRLIQHIVSSLRASSISEYRELILELHGLERALHEIEHLKCHPSQEPAVSGIKVAALMCQYPLDEFAGRLRKFDGLITGNAGHMSRVEKLKLWGKKLRWVFCMEEEVMKLRAYLVAHVGSLNMRLITQGLKSASFMAEQNQKGHDDLDTRVEKSHMEIIGMRLDLQANGSLVQSNNSILTKLSSFVTGDVVPQLKTLVDLVSKVWQLNLQIMSFIANHQASTPSPELRYTWVQEPIKFEDAMGRVIPIPSEYNWGASRSLSQFMVRLYSYVLGQKLEAIIMAHFDNGPGYKKICAGEYELFNTLDSSQIISRAVSEVLTPGLSVTMAIVIWQYNSGSSNRCQRPGCKSDKITSNDSGGKICFICKACFDLAQKPLPLPLRPPNVTFSLDRHRAQGMKRRILKILADGGVETQRREKKMRMEARMFKNFRISTPTIWLASLAPDHTDFAILDCPSCSKQFAGNPQDAKSNLQHHLRKSRRHNKDRGRKCPLPECRSKPAMRFANLGPHLQNFHKMSLSEANVIRDQIKSTSRRVDEGGISRRFKRYDSATMVQKVELGIVDCIPNLNADYST